jgi:hypothetical protein
MSSVPSSCRMVALGDTDPLEWHRFHISSFPHSTAFQIVFRLQWIATATFKKPPVQEWRRCPPSVVWHWATLTLWSGTDSNFPLETARTLSKWLWASNGPLKPPCKASRSRMASVPSSCRWSLWATLTLWSGTDSVFPCLQSRNFPHGRSLPLDRKCRLSKASRSRISSVRSHCRMVALGDAGTCSRSFLHLSTLNAPTHL